jgi:hypothetical protein
MSVEEMLRADSAIVRALAMLDRRLGKRRLARLSLAPDEIALVRGCYALRCEAEGIVPATKDGKRIGPPERYSEGAITQRVERQRRFYKRLRAIPARRSAAIVARYARETSDLNKALDSGNPSVS